MRLTRRLTPKMVEQNAGVIINISTFTGVVPTAGFSAYAAAKHGLHVWSHCCSLELQPHNVKVVCVQPGCTLTNMTRWEGAVVACGTSDVSKIIQIQMNCEFWVERE